MCLDKDIKLGCFLDCHHPVKLTFTFPNIDIVHVHELASSPLQLAIENAYWDSPVYISTICMCLLLVHVCKNNIAIN